MKYLLLGICCILLIPLCAQKTDLAFKMDSIIQEADKLYLSEKTAWVANDVAYQIPSVRKDFGGYLIYQKSDSMHAVFLNQETSKATARITYHISDFKKPASIITQMSDLDPFEQKLRTARNNFYDQLNRDLGKMDYHEYEGFNPNIVLIPAETGYHGYIIMGATTSGVIPFGNDYFFELNEEGIIQTWKKFHKTLIIAEAGMDDLEVIQIMHSHLEFSPYISATDICTFRLYAWDIYQIPELGILSTALGNRQTYHAETNTITIKNIE